MIKILLVSLSSSFLLSACGQDPGIKVHVYSRVTIPGIRPETDKDDHNFPKTYFIYAEAKKGTKLSVEGYWIDGKYYIVSSFEKVASPVIITNQTVVRGQKDTLVKKTSNEVYQVMASGEKSRSAGDAEKKLVKDNQFVLVVKADGKQQFITVATIKELEPEAMM